MAHLSVGGEFGGGVRTGTTDFEDAFATAVSIGVGQIEKESVEKGIERE